MNNTKPQKLLRRIPFIVLFIFIVTHGVAQINDAGTWQNIYLEKLITRQWNIHFNYESRINQNFSNYHYAYGDFGITYKLNKHIHLMGDYVFIEKKDKNGFWNISHQAYVAVTFKQKFGHFAFSYRIMPQIQYVQMYSSENGMVPDYELRNKMTIKYNNASRYTYYVACELYYRISGYYKTKKPEGMDFDRVRYFAGVFYKLDKVNEVELYYLIEKHFDMLNPITNFVIGVGYAHTFY